MFKPHLVRPTLALALAGLTLAGSIARAETQQDMARDLVPAQKPLFQPGSLRPEAVEAWVDNASRVYRVGQQLRVLVRPRRTSYITVLNVGTSGKVSVIFPNFYQRKTRVRAGRTVSIPARRAGWRLAVSGPPGIEIIKVIASREPLDLPELTELAAATAHAPVLSLDRSGEDVARDLVPQLKPAGSAATVQGVRDLLVRVLPRRAMLPGPAFALRRLTGGLSGARRGLGSQPGGRIAQLPDAGRPACTSACRVSAPRAPSTSPASCRAGSRPRWLQTATTAGAVHCR